MTDKTHAATARSWLACANDDRDFPIQNLPLGIFRPRDGSARCGMAIGDQILDLSAMAAAFSLSLQPLLEQPVLNPLLAAGPLARRQVRACAFDLLREDSPYRPQGEAMLHAQADCTMQLPAKIGGYTDFYAGIHHAENVGRLFRPDTPLLPNYRHVPIGYHGRTSSIRPSGAAVRRPAGQLMRAGASEPDFGPCERLDFEAELGIWIGPGNPQGQSIPIGEAGDRIAGYSLLNDWSARDIQAWEYQPLGPFLAKNFASTVSPWVITPEALAPFRIAQSARSGDEPQPLPYLMDPFDQAGGALDIMIEVAIRTSAMRAAGEAAAVISRTSSRHLYWTPAQLVAHHSCNGCNLEPGDLLGTGTISAPGQDGMGSLLEMTRGGAQPVRLPNGEERKFLQDGDEVVMTARCEREGFASIGFGECRGSINA